MLITERDCKRGGQRFAIPKIGEVQGRLAVSEVVAVECLRALLASRRDKVTLSRIERTILAQLKEKCAPFALSNDEQEAAMDYARQLLKAASVEARTAAARPSGRSTNG